MAQLKKKAQDKPAINIAPMIDCVFLLLIYFLVSATLQKQEADIAFQLPGTVEQSEPLDMPDEQIIEIDGSGQVVVNAHRYDSPASSRLIELTAMLMRFKQTSDANKTEAMVTIAPEPGTLHQHIVRVMDACAAAGITAVNFSFGEE